MRITVTIIANSKNRIWVPIMKFIQDKDYILVKKQLIENGKQYTIILELDSAHALSQNDFFELESLNVDICSVSIQNHNLESEAEPTAKSALFEKQNSTLLKTSKSSTRVFAIIALVLITVVGIYAGFEKEPIKEVTPPKTIIKTDTSAIKPTITLVEPKLVLKPEPELSELQLEQLEIEKLVAAGNNILGETDLSAGLITNALVKYQQALAMEPDNSEAIIGLELAVDCYIDLMDQAISSKDTEQAQQLLQLASAVLPDQPVIQKAQQRLQSLQDELLANKLYKSNSYYKPLLKMLKPIV